MIAGKQKNDTEKIAQIKAVLRKLCPDIGFLEESDANGQLILCGKEIVSLCKDLDTLEMFENILAVNSTKTRAILSFEEMDEKLIMQNERRGESICATV